MIDIPPRCPFCANVLKIQPTFWTHLGFKPAKVHCPTCQRDFEQCDAQKIFRHFIRGKADVEITGSEVQVTYPRRAHNPILREVPWHRLPQSISWLDGAKLTLKFQ